MPEFPPDKIDRAFSGLFAKALPNGCSAAQQHDLRQFFFAGALAMFNAMMEASEHPNEDICEARVEQLHRELERRREEFAIEATIYRRRN